MEIKDNEMPTVGSRIDFIIKSNNLKKTDFARMIRVSKTHVSDVITDKENLSPSTIRLISQTFNINEDWLINGEGDIYIEEPKYNDRVNRIIKEFDNLNPDFQDIAIIFFSYLGKIQDRLNHRKN